MPLKKISVTYAHAQLSGILELNEIHSFHAMENQGNGDIASLLYRLTEPLDSLHKDVEYLK